MKRMLDQSQLLMEYEKNGVRKLIFLKSYI